MKRILKGSFSTYLIDYLIIREYYSIDKDIFYNSKKKN